MKILLFILSFLVFSNGNDDDERFRKILNENNEVDFVETYAEMSANMDEYMDKVMLGVGPWISTILPMPLPDFKEEISYKPLLITYKGELNLSGGSLTKLQSVKRIGKSTMSYDSFLKFLRVDVGAELKNMQFKYDYNATIWNIGPSGWLIGDLNSFVMAADFIMDLESFYIYMQDFRIVSLGKISISLKGNWLTDWFASILVNTVTFLFKSSITEHVSDRVKEFVQETIDQMNENQFQYLNPAEMQQKIMENVKLLQKIKM